MSLLKYTECIMRYWAVRVVQMLRKPASRYFLLLGVLGCVSLSARAQVIEEVIARVNDRIIVLSEYNRRLEDLRQELGQQLSGAERDQEFRERSKDVLRDLIDQQLLLQKATEMGLNLEADLVKRLDAIRQQLNLPSLEALEKAVTDQGMNYEDFRQNLRENLLTQQVISREVGPRVVVTPKEIQDYYEQHKKDMEQPEGIHILQILISTEGKKEEELADLRKKAEETLGKARNGQDFAELARQYSDDSTASKGGDVGFVEQSLLAPEIQRAVGSLKTNEVSDLLQTQYGFLIVKLLERSSGGIPPLSEVEARIHEQIYFEKIQPALRDYLTDLRGESYIFLKPGYLDSGEPPKQASNQKP
ncbi:MAG: hypothetical protein A3G20_09355 [Acidobacteria bacterium RIFCSPLOWO2_12_FULL_59_11]|nr:MAG: hypothetical protein A3G20_09355 [Acidobacteria bacterium RIFCSPLOWO2_12_FULL_59_11]